MVDFTLVALKDEIVADPEGIGYKNSATPNDWKSDQVIADLINDPAHSTGITARISTPELKGVVDASEYQGLSPSEESYLNWLTTGEWTDMTAESQSALFNGGANRIWGVSSASAAAIEGLATVPFSRAFNLFTEGKSVSVGEIGRAFNEI